MKKQAFQFLVYVLALVGLVLLACEARADITGNYTHPFYAGYEERAEANGYVIIYGDSAYGTAIGLTSSPRHNGDSAFISFVLRQNCPDNQPDSCYLVRHPHRSYVNGTFRGFAIGTTNIVGSMMECPCWFQTWYYLANMPLHSHGPGLINDWFSPLTITQDTTDNGDSVVTVGIDSLGYAYLEHVPLQGQQIHTYQLGPTNDPSGAHRALQGQWHLLQVFYDTRVTHTAIAWIDGVKHSAANVTGRVLGVAHFHFGMYASPAVATGTLGNDETVVDQVESLEDGISRFMAVPTGR